MITHVVVFWTDKPQDTNRDRLIQAANDLLGRIPGAQNFRVGAPVASNRGVVDDSFCFAISMDFPDQAAADTYQQHPEHIRFVNEFVKPLVKRFVVYDYAA